MGEKEKLIIEEGMLEYLNQILNKCYFKENLSITRLYWRDKQIQPST